MSIGRCVAARLEFSSLWRRSRPAHSVAADPPWCKRATCKPNSMRVNFGSRVGQRPKICPPGRSATRSWPASRLAQNAVGRPASGALVDLSQWNERSESGHCGTINQLGPSAWPEAKAATARKTAKPGGNDADFDSLIGSDHFDDRSHILWSTLAARARSNRFPTGVYVDADGVMHRLAQRSNRREWRRCVDPRRRPVNRLQCTAALDDAQVSLTLVEKEVRRLAAMGRSRQKKCTRARGFGSHQARAGVSGNARHRARGAGGRLEVRHRWPCRRAQDSGRPVLQLDDLVLITRHMLSAEQTKFGYAIHADARGGSPARKNSSPSRTSIRLPKGSAING